MPAEHGKCIVCESPCTKQPGVGDFTRYDCHRCGAFVLTGTAESVLPGKLAETPLRRSLMSHTLRRMQRPSDAHLRQISSDDLSSFWSVGRLPTPQQQADNLILWIGDNQEGPAWSAGTSKYSISAFIGVVISPNGEHEGFEWLYHELKPATLYELHDQGEFVAFKLTMRGWEKYEELKKKDIESRTAFMAMKFGDATLNRTVDECFRPAVERAGFRLRVLTDEQPAGLIDDQLRAAILSSRFLVADLTHGNQGAYWEAGFAEGLGLPVIYTCETTRWKESKTHFDTNHMVTIVWDLVDLLKAQHALTATIRATLRAEAKQND